MNSQMCVFSGAKYLVSKNYYFLFTFSGPDSVKVHFHIFEKSCVHLLSAAKLESEDTQF